MTTTSTTGKTTYNGDDSTVAFPTGFKFVLNSHVMAILRDASDTETTWVEGTDYTLTGAGVAAGGTLTATTAPATGEVLTIILDVPFTQEKALPLGGAFPSTQVEEGLDLAVMGLQKLNEVDNRTFKVPETDSQSGSQLDIPIDTVRALKFLAFDAAGQAIAAAGTSASLGPVSAFIDTLLPAVDAATARTTLEAAAIGANVFTGRQTWVKGADLASATTLVLGADGNMFDVTGTTGITGVTAPAGLLFVLQFDGALTLTQSASLDLPGGDDIVTAAGDRLIGFAVAANTVLVLNYQPANLALIAATTAEMQAATGANRLVTPANLSDAMEIRTPIATTSGTSHDFTAIRAGAKRITIAFNGVSLDAVSDQLIQIGGGGGIETAGYSSSASDMTSAGQSTAGSTAGFIIKSASVSYEVRGAMTLVLADPSSNLWVAALAYSNTSANSGHGGGTKALSGELTQLRWTSVSGTANGDNGSINIMVE